MTQTAKKLIAELKKLPDDVQEKRAASYLEDLRQQKAKEDQDDQEDPYSALKILRDAKLSGPSDASVTYEKELYGPFSEGHD